MPTGPANRLLPALRRAVLGRQAAERSDGELVSAFVNKQDADSFAELVHRHGPMVLGVCRRVVGDPHTADDAFQAVFLVLARRAAAVRPRERVGNWLYGVAYRTAIKAR
ncbi:MAG TPA: sigma-70 family RNA polymerase sigma factor, partial [Gemmataceae bacterium]|nr:sigma-70 family RNA polymerase sigma factor [Gemmataceae bacterium]